MLQSQCLLSIFIMMQKIKHETKRNEYPKAMEQDEENPKAMEEDDTKEDDTKEVIKIKAALLASICRRSLK